MKHINFLIKPASSACNLRCRYCFYEDESVNRSVKNMGLMSPKTVKLLLTSAYEAAEPGGSIHFAFQGGEPTVAGLPFFMNFVSQARKLCPPSVHISFAIQTNGTLLDQKWTEFFRQEDFLVGISLDGFKDVHNLYRVDSFGSSTWNRVTKAVNLLQKNSVKVNALCVVTAQFARSPIKAYNELKKLGFDFMQFIACLDPIGKEKGSMPYSLTPELYGNFLCKLFDLWYEDWNNGNYHSVRLFEDYIQILLSSASSTCATCGRCGSYFVVEGDGSLYPCDFYAIDNWKIGNLGEASLSALAESSKAKEFLQFGAEKPRECYECRYGTICHGGCKNDWIEGINGPHNYFCSSFKTLLDYAMPRMQFMARKEASARRQNS